MATSSAERRTLDALSDAAAAAKTARKVAKDLSPQDAEPVLAAAAAAKDVAKTSKKAMRKHPKRVRKRAAAATAEVLKATEEALAATEQKVHEDAAQVPPDAGEPLAEPPAAPEELSLLTVAELRERARARGRVGYSRLNKAALIDFLS